MSALQYADLFELCSTHTQTNISTAWKAVDNDICRHHIVSIILCVYTKEHLWSERLGKSNSYVTIHSDKCYAVDMH
jgi:hypothetical protein